VAHSAWVNFVHHSAERVRDQSFHLREEVTHEAQVFVGVVDVEEALKVIDGKLVSIFKLTVVF
jgi:hypothetical protein